MARHPRRPIAFMYQFGYHSDGSHSQEVRARRPPRGHGNMEPRGDGRAGLPPDRPRRRRRGGGVLRLVLVRRRRRVRREGRRHVRGAPQQRREMRAHRERQLRGGPGVPRTPRGDRARQGITGPGEAPGVQDHAVQRRGQGECERHPRLRGARVPQGRGDPRRVPEHRRDLQEHLCLLPRTPTAATAA